MKRIDRYLFAEILGPFGIGLLIYTGILVLQSLFELAEMIIRRGVPALDVARLLLLQMPSILVLTIPMALLFALLVAIGRLSAETELTAMRSCGLSLTRLYRPVLLFSLLATLVTGFFSVYLLPRANARFQTLSIRVITQSANRQIDPRTFVEQWPGMVLYVFGVSPGGESWNDVFLAEEGRDRFSYVTLADTGRLVLGPQGQRLILELEQVFTHKVDVENPDRYQLSYSAQTRQLLEERLLSSQTQAARSSPGVRSMTLSELQELRHDPEASPARRHLAAVEIHKKFSLPFACLVFGLLGLPLGITRRRGGKSSGFAISILVILGYYVLLVNGERAAELGKMPPWLAMWLPNLVLAALGLLLLWRRNLDRNFLPLDLLLGPLRRLWDRLDLGADHPAGHTEERPFLVIRVPHFHLRFPNLLDRYIMRRFGVVFVLVALTVLALYVIADFTENADEIVGGEAGMGLVLSYYKYLSLQIFFDLAPVMVLITTLATFSLLARSNEVTAAKSLGTSLYRLAVPAIVAAAIVMVICMTLQFWVLPASNQRVAELGDQIAGRETARSYLRADRHWLFGRGRYIFNYQYFDIQDRTMRRVQVFEFDEQNDLVRRIYARIARYTPGGWIFSDGWVRTFKGTRVTNYRRFPEAVRVDYPENPEYFLSEVRPPEQMSFGELQRYVEDLKRSGQRVPALRVALQQKLAFPVITLVMALVALPFAFRLGRRGALYGVGVAIAMGLVFYGVYAFFTTLGEAGALPVAVAVWSPNILFGLLALYLFLGVRT